MAELFSFWPPAHLWRPLYIPYANLQILLCMDIGIRIIGIKKIVSYLIVLHTLYPTFMYCRL